MAVKITLLRFHGGAHTACTLALLGREATAPGPLAYAVTGRPL